MKNVILELTHIVQQVALLDSHQAQVELIVDSISQVVGIDVCSLYRADEHKNMVLLASHGLTVDKEIVIPAGKGLVGLVAQYRHTVNVADSASHPNYYAITNINEEQFKSFCGVPLVSFGEVIGVLVVQGKNQQKLSAENEGFLFTLGSQLAFIVANIIPNKKAATTNERLQGIKGAPGIGIGIVRLCGNSDLYNVIDAPCLDIEQTLQQWVALLAAVKQDIREEQQALGDAISSSVAAIFDSYYMLLSDQALSSKVEAEIRAGTGYRVRCA
ncbi:GAF domain-containing protein [Oceanicoccus sp. KOV_DT_Chl]|uniref:GAF domain-containing protein n=1 Tax=Oceanicoccus sp. KOV_DT_Chl TaxID=1904639 RepID=UPI00135A8EE6|nr:GAF domain-containing protein [Oceanicoccus sp. KOV_DT_Chl]